MSCKHRHPAEGFGVRYCTDCGEDLEPTQGMQYCNKCDHEYEAGSVCLCVKYRRYMNRGLDILVPEWWIRENWYG